MAAQACAGGLSSRQLTACAPQASVRAARRPNYDTSQYANHSIIHALTKAYTAWESFPKMF